MTTRMRWFLSLAIAGAVTILGRVDSAAGAIDLTGEWEFTFNCEDTDPTGKTKTRGVFSVPISQVGTAQDPGLFNLGAFLFHAKGRVVENPDKPGKGAVAFLICTPLVEPNVDFFSADAKVSVNSRGNATMMNGRFSKTTSVAGGWLVERCTFKAKRVSPTPSFTPPGCP